MKIAIFGGTFDPFTKAHEAIVNKVLDEKLVDEVIIAPTITNWYRDKNDVWLNDQQRRELCYAASDWIELQRDKRREATKDYSITGRVVVWHRDLDRKMSMPEGPIRDTAVKSWHFIDTLMDIITDRLFDKEDELYVIVGADQLKFFKQWHRWEDILKLAKLIVVNGRNGEFVESDIPHIDIQISQELSGVSATEIRKDYRTKPNGFKEYLKLFKEPPAEQLIYKSPIFNVVLKPDPDEKIGFCPVGINSPEWACILAEKDKQFLMVKQMRYGLMKEFTEFPCGMVEKMENPIYAAKRELCEETGIHLTKGVADLVYLGKYAANPAFMSNYMHYFYVNLDTAEWVQEEQHLDEHEKLELHWKPRKDLLKNRFAWFDGSSVFFAGAVLKMIQKGIARCEEFS